MTTIQVYRNRRNSNKCAEGIRCDRNDRQQQGRFSKSEIDKCNQKDRERRKKKCMK